MSDATIKANIVKTPEVNDAPSGYIESLIVQAKQVMIEYTRHDNFPGDVSGETEDTAMEAACVRLVVAMYRRTGLENAETYSVGDLDATNYKDFPPEVKTILDGKRRARW